jgi:cellobiose phosphorylase
MNDRGSGFSRYKNILLNRYRKISADHYGTYLYIRNLNDDHLWCATYAPLDVKPGSYHVSFASDKLVYQRLDDGVETKTEVTVLKDRAAELRRYTFTNNNNEDVELEITSYGEVVLAKATEDESHRVFNGMKILSEYDAEHQSLIFSRPGSHGNKHYLLHKLWVDSETTSLQDDESTSQQVNKTTSQQVSDLIEYETSRMKFLGRGGSIRHADTIDNRRTLSGTVGTTLDPIMSMRRRLLIPAGSTIEAYILTGFSKSKEQLLQLTEQYRTAADVEHAFKTSSVFNNMRTSLSLLKGSQMRLYNNMSKYLVQTATLGNHRNDLLATNTLSQSDLWRFGISGDLAILLLEVDDIERSGFAKEMMRAFEYFKVHGLMLDLVIINDVPEKDRETLDHFIHGMAGTEHLWAEHNEIGKVFVLNGNDVTPEERILLHTVARLAFSTKEGVTLTQQLRRLELANQHYQDKIEYPVLRPKKDFRVWSDLEFYNQYGGFDNNGRDYVVTNTNTPMPWVNVISNPRFGCVASSTMAGFTFAYNAQQFKLTGWSNDIVRDNASEMLLIDRQQFLPATARHGQGFSAYDANYDDLKVDVRLFVSIDKMEKYYQIRVEN